MSDGEAIRAAERFYCRHGLTKDEQAALADLRVSIDTGATHDSTRGEIQDVARQTPLGKAASVRTHQVLMNLTLKLHLLSFYIKKV